MNQPPIIRSRWTAQDEANLLDLALRKQRVFAEARAPLELLVRENCGHESEFLNHSSIDNLISNADAFITALLPFSKESS